MKKNVGNVDRIVRTIASLVVLFFVLNGTITGTTGTILAIAAVILLGTSIVSLCPLYMALGLSTRKQEN